MFRKTISLFAGLLNLFIAMAQMPSNINGKFDTKPYGKVGLFKVYNGRLVEIATSEPDSQGKFAFRFSPEYEGIYAVGTGNALNQENVYRFYFKGGEDLNYVISENGYELTGKNSKENNALFAWDKQSKTFKDKGTTLGHMSTYVDFFPEVEAFKGEVSKIGRSVKTGNPVFDKFFPVLVDYDFAFYTTSYLYMPRRAHPSKEEMSEYYNQFNPAAYLTNELFNFPYGDRFLNVLVFRKVDLTKRPTFDQLVDAIPTEELKGQYVLNRLEGVSSYDDYLSLFEKYHRYFTLPEQIQRATAVETKLVETKTGKPAFQFSFPDIEGKKTGLADLKGKVVLLDMWATWCGPCREEEPYWEKLNEEYKDKAVAFVGVSFDKDKDKWEEYVKKKKMKGIQLHAGSNNPLAEAYKVSSIPRYLLIDKSGNLITSESPRPSDPELKQLLDEWLLK